MKAKEFIEDVGGISDEIVQKHAIVNQVVNKTTNNLKEVTKMKRIHVVLIAAVMSMVIGASAIAAISARNRQEVNMFNVHDVKVEQFVDDSKVYENEGKLGEIPVFAEDDLLYHTEGYELSRDFCFWNNQNAHMTYTGRILTAYPDPAIREREDGTLYFVYDTDTGYRLFLFFTKDNDLQDPIGFPVVIKEMLSHKDFDALKIGDTIGDVAELDPVAEIYRKKIIDVWDLQPKGAAAQAGRGYPCTSIHYLKDGILKIEYEMTEDRELVIKNMVFSEDYTLVDALGRTIDFKIVESDLPR